MPRANPQIDEEAIEARDELQDQYTIWSTKLTDHSIQLSYAIIAANWAAHRPATEVTNSPLAMWSLAVVVLFLAVNMVGEWWMAHLLKARYDYAEENPERWEQQEKDSRGKKVSWPYTPTIDGLATILRYLKVGAPATGALLFALSLCWS